MPTTRGQKRDAEMEAALKVFFSSPRFAVAGASSDPHKYGHKSTLEYPLPVLPGSLSSLTRYHSIRLVSPALPPRNAFEPAKPECYHLEPCPHNRAVADSSSGPTSIQLFSVGHYATYSDEAIAQRGEGGWNSCCMAPAWKFRCRSSRVRES